MRNPSDRDRLPLVPIVAILLAVLVLTAPNVRADVVRLLDGDSASFQARLDLVRAARSSINAAYFALIDDSLTRRFLAALANAARRGVQVRLLVDGCHDGLSPALKSRLNDSGVEVRFHNPPRWYKPHRTFYRMHEKILVVDGEGLVVGGRNIGEPYFGMSREMNFSDRDVLIVGPAGRHADMYFRKLWESKQAVPSAARQHAFGRMCSILEPSNLRRITHSATKRSSLAGFLESHRRRAGRQRRSACATSACGCCPCDSEPFDVPACAVRFVHSDRSCSGACRDITEQLLSLIASARRHVVIETPYLVLSKKFEERLGAASARGIEIHILTNSLGSTNKVIAHSGYECQKKRLLQLGINLWEYQGAECMHAKCWVVDDRAVIGSYNLDPRSDFYDTQAAIIVCDRALASSLLASMVHRHQSRSVLIAPGGTVVDPNGVRNDPPALRSAWMHLLKLSVPLTKRHL